MNRINGIHQEALISLVAKRHFFKNNFQVSKFSEGHYHCALYSTKNLQHTFENYIYKIHRHIQAFAQAILQDTWNLKKLPFLPVTLPLLTIDVIWLHLTHFFTVYDHPVKIFWLFLRSCSFSTATPTVQNYSELYLTKHFYYSVYWKY